MPIIQTMRNHLYLLILVLLATGLGSYWAQIRSVTGQGPARPASVPQASPLLNVDPAQVIRLEIRRGRDRVISVRRDANQTWHVESPFHVKADAYLVDRTLTVLGLLSAVQTLTQKADSLSQFGLGLEETSTTITVETDHARQWLEIGEPSANGTWRYARSSDLEGIALIEQKRLQAIPQDAGDLLDRRIFPLTQDPLHTIEVTDRTGAMVLQAGNNRWTMESPVHAPTDQRIMTEWLQRLAGLHAAAVRPADPRPEHHSPSPWIGSLRMAAGQVSVTTEFFRVAGQTVVRRSDQPSLYFELSSEVLPAIFPDPFALRDKHLIHADTGEVALVEFAREDRSVRLVRTKTGPTIGWVRQGRLLPRNQTETMDRWLAELHLLEGSALLPAPARCGMTGPSRWRLALRGYNDQPLGRLRLARTQACGDVATLPSGEWVRLQNTALIDQIQLMEKTAPPNVAPALSETSPFGRSS